MSDKAEDANTKESVTGKSGSVERVNGRGEICMDVRERIKRKRWALQGHERMMSESANISDLLSDS